MFKKIIRIPGGEDIPDLKRPILPATVTLAVLISGTIGYYLIWSDTDATFIDALYMTIITITTVGYSEIYPLDDLGRIFTAFVSVLGIGSLFYVLSVVMENLVIIQLSDTRAKKKMFKKIQELKDHIIVVGHGRVGKLAAEALGKNRENFVVIDEHFEDSKTYLEENNILHIRGDGAEDAVLLRAGIERARGIIITTPNPSTTVFVTLSAKVHNPKIFIVARSDDESAIEKLRRAGADRIVNPYSLGGLRLANLVINRHAVDFLETNFAAGDDTFSISKMELSDDCPWYGKSLKDLDLRNKSGATILSVVRGTRSINNPGAEFTIKPGDRVVAIGSREELKRLEELSNFKD